MNGYTVIGLLITFLSILLLIRNNYTLSVMNKASDLISKYSDYLIDNGKYSRNINYQKEMKIDYNTYLYKFWIFGVHNAFKPQYIELIKSFEKYHEQQVKDVIYNDFNNGIELKNEDTKDNE